MKRKPVKRSLATEHEIQVALFEWADLQAMNRPELALLFAIPNGGQRHPAVALKMKREGVKRGVPDICLPVPKNGLNGLWLELKRQGGRVKPEQKLWHERLRSQGYRVELAYSTEEGIAKILEYLR